MAIKFGGKSLGPKAKKAGNTETKTVFLIFREQGTLKSIKYFRERAGNARKMLLETRRFWECLAFLGKDINRSFECFKRKFIIQHSYL